MSQILLREINKYNNSIGYFSKNKKLSYSSTDIYLGTSEKNKPIILNWEESRSATALYGCPEKMKKIYLNLIMQAIESDVPFTIVNTLFAPEEIEDKVKYKLSNTPYKYSVYNIEKEDLENKNINLLSKETSMIVHYHNSEVNENKLLRASFSHSFTNAFNMNNSANNNSIRLPHKLMILAYLSADIFFEAQFVAMGRGMGIYNFLSNNELDLCKIANTNASILLSDDNNLYKYKEILELFQLKQINEFDYTNGIDELKKQIKSKNNLKTNYNVTLNEKESYVIKNNIEIAKLIEIKKFYQ